MDTHFRKKLIIVSAGIGLVIVVAIVFLIPLSNFWKGGGEQAQKDFIESTNPSVEKVW